MMGQVIAEQRHMTKAMVHSLFLCHGPKLFIGQIFIMCLLFQDYGRTLETIQLLEEDIGRQRFLGEDPKSFVGRGFSKN
jgi:hypothetical protein